MHFIVNGAVYCSIFFSMASSCSVFMWIPLGESLFSFNLFVKTCSKHLQAIKVQCIQVIIFCVSRLAMPLKTTQIGTKLMQQRFWVGKHILYLDQTRIFACDSHVHGFVLRFNYSIIHLVRNDRVWVSFHYHCRNNESDSRLIVVRH